MQNWSIFISFTLIASILQLHAYSDIDFSRESTIAYPETGLFLDYFGQYIPSETIVHNSAVFPMTFSSCHFLLFSAAEHIPACNMTRKRIKRGVTCVLSLGIGTASLSLSIANTIQIGNLQQQVGVVENSLSLLSQTVQIFEAQLVKLTSKHIELTESLEMTQEVLNDLLLASYQNSEAISSLKAGLEQLHAQYQYSFLHLAITQIARNELTLNFLTSEDIHKVIYDVIVRGNLGFHYYYGSMPLVQIITKLLVRQQIDFVPSSHYKTNDSLEIGRLLITSYFAVPRPEQTPFHIYKLVTVPFFHENETIQIAHIPQYWGINTAANTTIEWQDPQEFDCDLRWMTTCRDTPPIRTISGDSCLDEIIDRRPLSKCHTISVPTTRYSVRHLSNNLWVTSSPEPLHCVKTLRAENIGVTQQTGSTNEEITLPSVSLVNVTEGQALVCPGFTLFGRPLISNITSLVILQNSSILSENISVMNVHHYLTKNNTWFKKKMTEQEKKALMDFVNKLDAISSRRTFFPTSMSSFGVLSSSWVCFGLILFILYHIYRCKRKC